MPDLVVTVDSTTKQLPESVRTRLATDLPPGASSWDDLEDMPAVIAAGATEADARAEIGALAAAEKGAVSGVAALDADRTVPLVQLPAVVVPEFGKVPVYDADSRLSAASPATAGQVATKGYVDVAVDGVVDAAIVDQVLAADQVRNNVSSTADAATNVWQWNALAGEVWHLSAMLFFSSSAVAGFKVNVKVPTGTLVYGAVQPCGGNVTLPGSSQGQLLYDGTVGTLSIDLTAPGAASKAACRLDVRIVTGPGVGGSGGAISLRAAQATAEATDTKILAGSWMLAARAATA